MAREVASSCRLAGTGCVLMLAAAAQSARPDQLEPPRERAVLAVLRELDFASLTAARHVYSWREDGTGTRCLVREQRPSTGFDRSALSRLQRHGERIALAFGIDWSVAADQAADPLARAFLGFDASRRVGWCCSGLAANGVDWLRVGVPEPADDPRRVTRQEASEDGARLCQVHTLQLLEADGEAMVAATLVDFLGKVAGGPPVDLAAVFFTGVQRVPIRLPDGVVGVPDEDGHVVVDTPRVLQVQVVVGGDGFQLRDADDATVWQPLRAPRGSRGHPTRLQVPFVARDAAGSLSLRVVQGTARDRVTATGTGGVALLGSRFEASRPFTVDLVFAPGRYVIDPHLLIGLPRAD